MESLVESLFQSFESNNPKKATQIVDELRSIFSKEIEHSSVERYILATVGDAPYSLLQFIVKAARVKGFDSAVNEALEVAYVLIKEFPGKLEHYVAKIIATCMAANNVGSALIQTKTLKLINNILLEKFATVSDKALSRIFRKVNGNIRFRETSKTVAAISAETIGILARHYSFVGDDEAALQAYLIQMLSGERHEAIPCLNDYLYSFGLSAESADLLHAHLLKHARYNSFNKNNTNTSREALACFAQHSSIFAEQIFENREKWSCDLRTWLRLEGELLRAGVKAMDAFNVQIASYVSKEDERHKQITKDLLDGFKENISNGDLRVEEKLLSVKALGYLALACKRHMGADEMNAIFLRLIKHVEVVCLQNEEVILPQYVEALSGFIRHLDALNYTQIVSLQRVTVFLIKLFPKLPKKDQGLASDALVMILYSIYTCPSYSLRDFLSNVTYDSVLWTCSHAMALEVVNEDQCTYKSFLPLWMNLVRLPRAKRYEKFGLEERVRTIITQAVTNELVLTLLTIVHKLDLKLQRKDDDVALSDPQAAFTANIAGDFAMFVNVADFYVDLLDAVEPAIFKKCVPLYNKRLIMKSLEHPLVSGFYKLLAASMKLCDGMGYFGTVTQEVFNYTVMYLRGVLLKVKYYKDDLQVGCLQLFLAAPLELIQAVDVDFSDLFVSTFTIGRRIFKVAELGVDALNRWCDNLPKDRMRPLLMKILPLLDSFLRSQAAAGPENINLETRKTKKTLKKRRILVESEPELLRLKKKILAFLGRMDGELCRHFVQHGGLAEVIWNKQMDLKVDLPYPENEMRLYLDKLMPRILELAVYCSARKTRFTACEVLHTAVLVFLGLSKQMSDTEHMSKLFARMCEAILLLGCDADKDICSLFKPLCFQLTHWYSSPNCALHESNILLDAFFEGIAHPSDGNLRDFSGSCVREFVHWIIKHNPRDQKLESNESIAKIVDKMRFLAKHPDSSKKLGAALIFNSIFVEFRERDVLLKNHWMDIVEIFANSFYTTDLNQIDLVMDRLLRVLKEKDHLLPIDNVTQVILKHCSSLNASIRTKCMDMVTKLGEELDDIDSSEFEHHLNHSPAFPGSDKPESIINWMSSLTCLIDGSIFAEKNRANFDSTTLANTLNSYVSGRHWDQKPQCNPIVLKHIEDVSQALHKSIIEYANSHVEAVFNADFCDFLVRELLSNSADAGVFNLIKAFDAQRTLLLTNRLESHLLANVGRPQNNILKGLIKLDAATGVNMSYFFDLSKEIDDFKMNPGKKPYELETCELKLQLVGRSKMEVILNSLKDSDRVNDGSEQNAFGLYFFRKFRKTIIGLLSRATLNEVLRSVSAHFQPAEACDLLLEVMDESQKDWDCLLQFLEEAWPKFNRSTEMVVKILSKFRSLYGSADSKLISNWVHDKFKAINVLCKDGEEKFSFIRDVLRILGCIRGDKSRICADIEAQITLTNPNVTEITLYASEMLEAAVTSDSIDLFLLAIHFCLKRKLKLNITGAFRGFSMDPVLVLYAVHASAWKREDPIPMSLILSELICESKPEVVHGFFVNVIDNVLLDLRSGDYRRKIVCYILLEAYFSNAQDENINALCVDCALGTKREFIAKVVDSAINVCKEPPTGSGEMFRMYQCYAYKALVTVVCKTQTDLELYGKLLIRLNAIDEDILWCKLIDGEAQYDFELLVEDATKFKRAASIDGNNSLPKVTYIESQTLFMSSLSQDVTKHDFTNVNIRSQVNAIRREVDLQEVPLSNHLCMSTVCKLIDHMFQENLIPEGVTPLWIQGLSNLLRNERTPLNTKLFLALAISKTQHVLKPFADALAKPLIDTVRLQKEINGFTHDMLILILTWMPKIVRDDWSNLVNHIVANVHNEHREIFKRNLMFLQHLIEFEADFDLDYEIVLRQLSEQPIAGIQISHILLQNGIKPWASTIQSFAKKLIESLLGKSTKTCRKAAETLGLALKYTQSTQERVLPKFAALVSSRLNDLLKTHTGPTQSNFYYALEGIAKYYPPICDEFLSIIVAKLDVTFGNIKIILLKILCARHGELNDLVDGMPWGQLVEDSNIDVQMLALEIVNKSVDVLSVTQLEEVVSKCIEFRSRQKDAKYRNVVYDILIQVYRRFSDSEDDLCVHMTKMAKDVLLAGLDETDPELQEQLMNFWLDLEAMPNKFYKRFLYILQHLYHNSNEEIFMGYSLEMLLKLLDNKLKNKVFPYPLHRCEYEEMKLSSNWRTHSTLTPMYAFSENALLATVAPQFEPTQRQTLATQRSQYMLNPTVVTTQNSQEQDDSRSRFLKTCHTYRRFNKNKSDDNKMYAARATKQNQDKEWARKDMSKRKEAEITVYRSYRIGDYPDIEITFEALLTPLLALAKNDVQISRLLFTNFFDFAVNTATQNPDRFMEAANDALNNIFQATKSFGPGLMSALLDISTKYTSLSFHPNVITTVAQSSGLISMGCLLLEEYLTHQDFSESTPKRIKLDASCTETDTEKLHWMRLAELYKDLGDWNVVHSIFLNHLESSELIVAGIEAESNGFWTEACNSYQTLLSEETDPDLKDFYYESFFRCSAELGKWSSVVTNIEQAVTSSERCLDKLFGTAWNRDKLLPYYFKAKIMSLLKDPRALSDFLGEIEELRMDPDKREFLESNYSDDLAFIGVLANDPNAIKHYVELYQVNFLAEWANLNPLYSSLRLKNIMEMRTAIDINHFLHCYEQVTTRNAQSQFQGIGKMWVQSSLETMGSVVQAETRNTYWNQFMKMFKRKCGTLDGEADLLYQLDANLVENALEQSHLDIAKIHLKKYGSSLNNVSHKNYHLTNLLFSKSLLLRAKTSKEKFNVLATAVKHIDKSLKGADLEIALPAALTLHEVTANIMEITSPKSYASLCECNINSDDDLIQYNLRTLASKLEECEKSDLKTDRMAEGFYKLANCHHVKASTKEKITFTLKSMLYGSKEGRLLFPRVLSKVDSEHVRHFAEECEKVPIWMFIPWIPQLLAQIAAEDKVLAVSAILLNLAQTYPNAIQYSYRLTKESVQNLNASGKELCDRLDGLLENPLIDSLLRSLKTLCPTSVVLKTAVDELMKSKDAAAFKAVGDKVLRNLFGDGSHHEKRFKDYSKYRKQFEALCRLGFDGKAIKSKAKALINSLAIKDSTKLDYYSYWLKDFKAEEEGEIEIPGQYRGDGRPLPEYHIKIAAFSSELQIMASLRKPMALTVIGSDGRDYKFLVKYDEDLRKDQRVQQMFNLMNDALKRDKRNLQIETYQVIPLASNLGLIEWVEDTVTLKKVVYDGINAKRSTEDIRITLVKWVQDAGSGPNVYQNALMKYNREEVCAKLQALSSRIRKYALKSSFNAMSADAENLFALRESFLKSYSVMCLCNWLLGVGDRHLSNILISAKNGRAIGIDFDSAFGKAIHLPVIEMVPFRLTPQLVNLCEPHNTNAFKPAMVNALKLLRDKGEELLSAVQVFIQDPTADWREDNDAKISFVRRKFLGDNPASIMCDEILLRSGDPEPVRDRYLEFVKGYPEHNARATKAASNLSCEDQVECLLDQATDYNLLGRIFYGWEPWV